LINFDTPVEVQIQRLLPRSRSSHYDLKLLVRLFCKVVDSTFGGIHDPQEIHVQRQQLGCSQKTSLGVDTLIKQVSNLIYASIAEHDVQGFELLPASFEQGENI